MARERILHITIKDCDVQTFRAGGKGGQHQNKTSSGVRIIHRASGARGESRDQRSQLQNKRLAFRRMAESQEFQRWIRLAHARVVGEIAREEARVAPAAVDQWVDKQMRPENLLVEYGPFR